MALVEERRSTEGTVLIMDRAHPLTAILQGVQVADNISFGPAKRSRWTR